MKTIRIDDNAHEILTRWKGALKNMGIEAPNFSDAIRGMEDKIATCIKTH